MSDYIDRIALLSFLRREANEERIYANENGGESVVYAECLEDVIADIERIPAADVAPVRHGAWEGTADGYADGELVYDMWNCSECGFDADGAEEKPDWKFCPNCGSLMDGGADNG